jgi:hypothetical protein
MVGLFSLPGKLGEVKFIPVYETLVIKAHKNSPAHMAFEEVISTAANNSEWDRMEKIPTINLNIKENAASLNRAPASFLARRVILEEMVLKKSAEVLLQENNQVATAAETQSNDNWIDELPQKQTARLKEAQRRTEVLSQNWNDAPTWSQEAEAVLEKSGAFSTAASKKVIVAAKGDDGQWHNEVPGLRRGVEEEKANSGSGGSNYNPATDSVGFVGEESRGRTIEGPLEITGGLVVTNEHHLEVRRTDEGVYKELGKVNLNTGTYNISVEDATGSIVARLVDKAGRILGEGSFRLSLVSSIKSNRINGPKLKVEPGQDFSGVITSLYNTRPEDVAPAKTTATFVKGESEVSAGKDGVVSMSNVMKGSTTVVRAAAPQHLQTVNIVVSGQEFRSQLYPEKMIKSLQDLVGQQRSMSLDGAPAIIWGKVSLDGKAVAGIEVIVESEPDLIPVYFNQWMIPDANLKATSENGLYAFVQVTEGFHSVLATRANGIFGYQNVVVENASVAQGDIENTMKKESIPLRVFDAFNGSPIPAQITMQSLDDELTVTRGSATLMLPQVSRLGIMQVQPGVSDFARATYFYNDKDAFIHVPVIRTQWLGEIRAYQRVDDMPNVGIVVGFVPDEDFEVYLAGYDQFPANQIVYFDMQGRILQNRKGIAGGGFILYNVPEDTHEVVILGARTRKMYSRVLPVDSGSISVLNFRE